jgi:hypothetical protein
MKNFLKYFLGKTVAAKQKIVPIGLCFKFYISSFFVCKRHG